MSARRPGSACAPRGRGALAVARGRARSSAAARAVAPDRSESRGLGANENVERIVLGRQLGPLQRGLDQACALLIRQEHVEEDRLVGVHCHYYNLAVK